MTSLLVTGYKSFELGIFKDKDPKVTIIKKAIKRDFKRFLDDGVIDDFYRQPLVLNFGH